MSDAPLHASQDPATRRLGPSAIAGIVARALACAAVVITALLANRTLIRVWYETDQGTEVGARLRWLHLSVIAVGLIIAVLRPHALAVIRRVRWWWVPLLVIGTDLAVAVISAYRLQAPLELLRCVPPLAGLSSLTIGVYLANSNQRYIDWTVAATAGIAGLTGLFQLGHRSGVWSLPGKLIYQWDTALRASMYGKTSAYHEFTFGRAQGFDINPDTYALLGVACLTWALFAMRRGPIRVLTMMACVLMVGLSESRTSMVLVAVLLLIGAIDLLRRRGTARQFIGALAFFAVTIGLVSATLWVFSGTSSARPDSGRLQTGIAATVGGDPQTDSSLSARIMAWQSSLELASQWPWGYWEGMAGRMQISPHNEYLLRLVYGGIPYLLPLLILLLWLAVYLRPPGAAAFGVATASWIAVSALVQDTTHWLPALTIGWFTVGAAMILQATAQASSFTEDD